MDFPPCTLGAVVAVADAFLVAVVVCCLSGEGVFGAGESGVSTTPRPSPLPAPEDAPYSSSSSSKRDADRERGRGGRVTGAGDA